MTEIYFEGRQLKPWAEYVPANDLREGTVYFRVQYLDKDLLVPALEPVVFLGRDLEPGDQGVIYFQDAWSYLEGVRPFDRSVNKRIGTDIEAIVHSMKAVDCHLLEYEKAIDVLLQCALRRRQKTG